MALYAIGDLHLSESADKPMDVFGGRWDGYTEKLKAGFAKLGADDVCVLCGDISWAMSLEEARADFEFISRLPGRKIVLKGNHDYWWATASKMTKFLESAGIVDISFLHNNCFFYGDAAVCGTRGWFYEEERGDGEHDRKIMLREAGRLEVSLKTAGSREIYVFLHYPPVYGDYVCGEILELFSKYHVKMCCYGHIHGQGSRFAFEGLRDGVLYKMVSADHVFFSPVKILE